MAAPTFLFILLFILPSSFSSPTMPPAELNALLDLLSGLLADPSWAELHPRPCTDTPWPGILCETTRNIIHVTGIHIGADFSSSPPCKKSAFLSQNALLGLPFLKTLSLFSCFLAPNSVSLPSSIFSGNLSSLEQLVLDSNTGLTGEIPCSVSLLKRLRVLCLSQNALYGVIPKEIGGLENLQELDLSYNRFGGEIPEEIGDLLSLEILDFSSNALQGRIPASIGRLHSLQKIDFGFNFLSSRVPPELGELKKLVLLDFSYNALKGPLPDSLSGLSKLEFFLMENNPIGTRIPMFLAGLGKLQVVGISGCGLFGSIPSFFASLVSLTALSLDRNRLNGSVPESLGSLPQLGQLNLSQNQLSGEIGFSEEFVRRLGKRFDVRENKGLCLRSVKYRENSFNFEAAPLCLDSTVSSSGNRSNNEGETGGSIKNPSLSVIGGASLGNKFCFFWLLGFQVFAIVVTLAV